MDNKEYSVSKTTEGEADAEEIQDSRRKAVRKLAYASPAIAAILLSKTAAAQASTPRFAPPPPPAG